MHVIYPNQPQIQIPFKLFYIAKKSIPSPTTPIHAYTLENVLISQLHHNRVQLKCSPARLNAEHGVWL